MKVGDKRIVKYGSFYLDKHYKMTKGDVLELTKQHKDGSFYIGHYYIFKESRATVEELETNTDPYPKEKP